ncbi:shikimate dehydrogenase family protein [Apibacter adventoris]|uniref:shikimate dehydrogenase family protein n=1 Tax=Apibacter adventoris TaxID=1679466 RepID=UPI000CF664AB|nr:shikimate dehydrogenase [Apibacter adventoris]PQL94800.1 shikimate dehydrogenase [Apibacter adventoris]
MKLGILGRNISYSFSQSYFTDKFNNMGLANYSYSVFDIADKKDIISLFDIPDLKGFNVTIPYKQDIIPFLDNLSSEAEKIGAVNTVKISNGKKVGFNTDALGFKNSLLPLLKPYHTSSLVLGSGGASKAVGFVLKSLGIEYHIISRTGEKDYNFLTQNTISENLLIVNTTPVGTFPNLDKHPPFPIEFLTHKHLVYDLIYNPEETKLLKLAKEKGAKTKNGLEMLHLQAEAAWDIWNDRSNYYY